jgi:hypothetical protein
MDIRAIPSSIRRLAAGVKRNRRPGAGLRFFGPGGSAAGTGWRMQMLFVSFVCKNDDEVITCS